MPRKARIDAVDAVQHIMARGIEGRNIFRSDSDRANFIERLVNTLRDTTTHCLAWALMPNHFHLLLRTGSMPMETVMRRVLTGYAVSFNLKYRRQGHLFQNRYKSILCQEDIYLKELARYIHLNPLRKGIVADLKALDKYTWTGHSAVMGYTSNEFQNIEYLLSFFGNNRREGSRSYRKYVEKGIGSGHRSDLTGGGLVRSAGGWAEIKALRRAGIKVRGDQRILGDGDFVERVLADEERLLKESYDLQRAGIDFKKIIDRAAEMVKIDPKEVLVAGKQPWRVRARDLVCFWSHRKLGMTTIDIARRLSITQSAVTKASQRGEKFVRENQLKFETKE